MTSNESSICDIQKLSTFTVFGQLICQSLTVRCPLCVAARRAPSPTAPDDSGMGQVMAWLFADGSSSVAGGDAESKELSVASMQARLSATSLEAVANTPYALGWRLSASYQ